MRLNRLLTTTAVLATTMAMPTFAQMVTLESFDKSISITGQLIEFENDTYVVRSPIGVMKVDALEMTCTGEACPGRDATNSGVRIAGSGTVTQDLIPALIDGYALSIDAGTTMSDVTDTGQVIKLADGADDTVVDIQLAFSDSTSGLASVANRNADIAIATRPARQNEIASIAGNGTAADREQVLALDGIVVVSHPASPVRAISERDLPGVFSGAISKWSQIGGYNADINIYIREPSSGTYDVFNQQVMVPAGARFSNNVQVLDSDQAVSDAVARDPFGIGISSYSALRNANALSIRGICGVQTPVNDFTIRTEEYPLTRRIYAYKAAGELGGHGGRLLDFALSDEGQFIVADAGFVDQRIMAQPVDAQGIRLASAVMDNGAEVSFSDLRAMMSDLVVGERLSLTYRFDFGSSRLDSRAVGDVQRLAALLSTGSYENKEVLLVGFSDAIGEPGKNRILSQARASVVRDALINAAPPGSLDNIKIRTAGFGEASPLGCNETDKGRQTNRRVEVWVSDLVRQVN